MFTCKLGVCPVTEELLCIQLQNVAVDANLGTKLCESRAHRSATVLYTVKRIEH